MMRISEVSRLTGVSIRRLRYYDEIGLLRPTRVEPENGYRFYDEAAMEQLQTILFYQAVGIPLVRITALLNMSEQERRQALMAQRGALLQKRAHLDRLIALLTPVPAGQSSEAADARKRYCAECLRTACRTGTRQIVLLGSGEELLAELPACSVFRVSGGMDGLSELLAAEGFAPQRKTIFLWLNGGRQLPDSLDSLLKALAAQLADGSSLLLDCAGSGITEAELMKRLARHGCLLYDCHMAQAADAPVRLPDAALAVWKTSA